MEDPVAVAVPFAPLDQSLVPVDSVGALGSKVNHFYLSTQQEGCSSYCVRRPK